MNQNVYFIEEYIIDLYVDVSWMWVSVLNLKLSSSFLFFSILMSMIHNTIPYKSTSD